MVIFGSNLIVALLSTAMFPWEMIFILILMYGLLFVAGIQSSVDADVLYLTGHIPRGGLWAVSSP